MDFGNKKLSIIIPVFNEAQTVEELIKRVVFSPAPGWQKEIVVVDDRSSDGTPKILGSLKEKYGFLLLRHPKNLGKGGAIQTALRYVTGEAVLIQDADLEYDPGDYPKLLAAFSDNHPVIYGSRNLARTRRGYFLYYWGAWFLTAFFNLLFGSRLTDLKTGYKLFRADIIKNLGLETKGFEFCEEVTAKVLRAGYVVVEVPISYYPRKFSEGKKIRARDGLVGVWTMVKYRFG